MAADFIKADCSEQCVVCETCSHDFAAVSGHQMKMPENRKLWDPPPRPDSKIRKFVRILEKKYQTTFPTYHELHKWSVENRSKFWAEVWTFCGVVASKEAEVAVDESKRIDEFPEWFAGARLNYAENLLRRKDAKTAIVFAGESLPDGRSESLSFQQLNAEVQKYAASLRALGVKNGDVVAGYMPNNPECVIAMLATASIGACWTSTSVDFGVMGVLDRFTQVHPKVLFSVEAVVYNQKTHLHLEKVKDVLKQLPSVEHTIIIPFLTTPDSPPLDISAVQNGMLLEKFLSQGVDKSGSYPQLVFEQVPFNHPLFVMFSSGTTGKPKCMVHSVGGTLLKHLEEHILQGCTEDSDVILFYTTVGWMMWNWLVSALATGATIVLYDGSPIQPKPDVIFDLVDSVGITVLGMGAKCYSLYEQKELKPCKTHNLSSLHSVLSTGSPLKPLSFDWIYRDVKSNLLIGSISGGTDIIACFMGHTWMLPVHRGEIQAPFLGLDMECWDEQGNPVLGERGELVCKRAFPSMPTHFLNDETREKYKKAYFKKYEGVWAHGDYCIIDKETKGILMLGRSDGTLNPGGVRFGSSEIYHVVESYDEVADSLCVGQKVRGADERVLLFLKMNDSYSFTPELAEKVKSDIRRQLTAKHVPALVLPIADIPYTANGKKVEVAVKQIIAGETVLNEGALSNPDSLLLYRDLPELVV